MASGRFVCAVVLVVVPLLLSTASALDFSRVHLVDQSPKGSGYNNFLFRGDMPTVRDPLARCSGKRACGRVPSPHAVC